MCAKRVGMVMMLMTQIKTHKKILLKCVCVCVCVCARAYVSMSVFVSIVSISFVSMLFLAVYD